MRNRKGHSIPSSLDDAIQCQLAAAEKLGLVPKRMADLMGVDVKTYYRWAAESSMPLNRVRQFEAFSQASFISEYLCTAHGGRVVITIPTGKKAKASDLGEMQANFGKVVMLLEQFYNDKSGLQDTIAVLSQVLSQVAYHRENVIKNSNPELELFGAQA
jgi:hypothetical protein